MRTGAPVLIVIALALSGCGGDSTGGVDVPAADDAGGASDAPTAAESATDPNEGSQAEEGQGGPGSATLTIGDQVYAFDNYYCRRGADNTRNDSIPFSSGAFGEVDGSRVQLDASVYDADGGDEMTGAGVSSSISLDDVDDFENPKVSWSSGGLMSEPFDFEYDGETLRAETVFDDELTDEIEEIPGTLEATCGS